MGYGCQLPALIAEWRRYWSFFPGTTAAQAPFGVVSLAGGGSEGNDGKIAAFRWSQTGNYGKLPNAAMPNTFLAHAFDLSDPMDMLSHVCSPNNTGWGPAPPNQSAFGPNGPCMWPPASRWNAAVSHLREAVEANVAPSFMGGIHPRIKAEVGRRLALAFSGVPSPTLAGCTLKGNASISLRFEALAAGDSLKLQWERARYNMSTWGIQDSMSLMVCVGKPGTPTPATPVRIRAHVRAAPS